MDLRQLRHFLAVVEHGSILRAAEAIHLTQPALSRSLQTLEGELGVSLFTRGRRGAEPSPHGLLLARHARQLVGGADDTVAALRGLRTDLAPRLSVGVGTHLAGLVLPQVVAGLLEAMPRLAVSVLGGSAEELITSLRRGEIDAALCAWPAEGAPPELRFDEMLRSDLVVVCRAVHPLARRRRLRLDDLASRRWALAERPRAIGEVLRLAFAAAGFALEPVVRSTSLGFLLALLQQADLLSFLPAGYVRVPLADGRLVQLRTDLPSATARVGLLRRTDDAGGAVVEAFVEALRAALRHPRLPAPSTRSRGQ